MPEAKYTVRTKRTKTTTELTVEQETFVTLRDMRAQRGWCDQCSAETSVVTPEEAAAATRVNVTVVYQWAEMGRLHFADAADGSPLVCLASLGTSD